MRTKRVPPNINYDTKVVGSIDLEVTADNNTIFCPEKLHTDIGRSVNYTDIFFLVLQQGKLPLISDKTAVESDEGKERTEACKMKMGGSRRRRCRRDNMKALRTELAPRY